jgi:hypothetical protein
VILHHTRRHNTDGRTRLDEWSASRQDISLAKHNNHNRKTSMPSVGFEPKILAEERPQTYALGRAATGIVSKFLPRKFMTDVYTHTHTQTHTQIYMCFVFNLICSTLEKYLLCFKFNFNLCFVLQFLTYFRRHNH